MPSTPGLPLLALSCRNAAFGFSRSYFLHQSIRAGWAFGSIRRPGRFSLFPSRFPGFTHQLLTSAPWSGYLSIASVAEATRSRSPGVSSAAFCAQSPNLRFAPLMDMNFAVSCPLVRRSRLISGFCSSTRTFDPCFFQTPPRGGSPCIITRPSPPSGWPEDLHLQAAEHAQHTTKPLARRTLRVSVVEGSVWLK